MTDRKKLWKYIRFICTIVTVGFLFGMFAVPGQMLTAFAAESTGTVLTGDTVEMPELIVHEGQERTDAYASPDTPDAADPDVELYSDAIYQASSTHSGLLGSGLTGMSKTLYQAIAAYEAKTPVTYTNNAVTYTHTLKSGETAVSYYKQVAAVFDSAMWAYQRDHQEDFAWALPTVSLKCTYNSTVVSFQLIYKVSSYYSTSLEKQMQSVLDGIKKNTAGMTTYEKLVYYHNWLVEKNEYASDMAAVSSDDGTKRFYYAHSQIGCLVGGYGVCDSYAKALKVLCMQEDIPCVIVSSLTHAWNYVRLEDGSWYMIDCTWDDTNGEKQIDPYRYFLISNQPNIDQTHTEDGEFIYPTTASEDFALDHMHSYTIKKNVCSSEDVRIYYVCACGDEIAGEIATDVTTIAKATDGNWYYYKKGLRQSTCTSVEKRVDKSTWWYVKNGQVQFSYTGVVKRTENNTWWYVKNGQVQFQTTSVEKNKTSNTWWYIKNGQVRFDVTGLVKRTENNTWWYVKNGKVQFSYTGLVKNSKGSWYVKNGQVQMSFTGTVKINGKSCRIENGKLTA